MTGHTTANTGRIENNKNRRIDDAFGPAVTPPHRPRPLVPLGVSESAGISGESVVLGEVERSVENQRRTRVTETATAPTGRDARSTEGHNTSQFIVEARGAE